jgi:hypothetical protein
MQIEIFTEGGGGEREDRIARMKKRANDFLKGVSNPKMHVTSSGAYNMLVIVVEYSEERGYRENAKD